MSNIEEEIFVQVDSNDCVIGPIGKSVSHAQDILHRTISILVFNQKGELLMQLRSKDKDLYPDLYTLSATGHVDWTKNGPEEYEQAAQREYFEELGKKPANPLIPQFTAELAALGHHTMTRVYCTQDDGPFLTKPNEVQRVEFLPLEEVKRLAEKITPPSKAILERLKLL